MSKFLEIKDTLGNTDHLVNVDGISYIDFSPTNHYAKLYMFTGNVIQTTLTAAQIKSCGLIETCSVVDDFDTIPAPEPEPNNN
jgi:hypothetical protein